jgi:hypothetical protein
MRPPKAEPASSDDSQPNRGPCARRANGARPDALLEPRSRNRRCGSRAARASLFDQAETGVDDSRRLRFISAMAARIVGPAVAADTVRMGHVHG